MKIAQTIALAALLSPASAADYEPPKTGKFFYTELRHFDGLNATFAVNASVGSSRVKLNLKLDT